MQPGFKTISDLFAVAQPDVLDVEPNERKKQGRNATESEELGRQSLSEGNYQTAIRHFRKAVDQRAPSQIGARIDLAGAYDYSDQYPAAYRQYEEALKIDQQAVEPHVGISDLYKRYGRFRDSIERLEEAVRLEPESAFLRIKLAEVLRDAGEPRRALIAAQQAVIVKPDDAFYHYWVGDLLIQLRRYDDALESLRAAIDLSPGDDFLYLRAAVAFWGAGRRPEAVKAIRLASDLDPTKHVYHGLLGILLAETGLPEEASLESNRAEKMDRYDHDTLSRLLDEMEIEP
jgi:tetratricopeptide (TPR) repeat protein